MLHKTSLVILVVLKSVFYSQFVNATNLNVYDPVPGLDASPFYNIRIKEKGKDHWIKTFPMVTECTGIPHNSQICNLIHVYQTSQCATQFMYRNYPICGRPL